MVDLVGNVTFSGPAPACAQAAALCAGLPVREDGHGDVVLMHEACRPFAPATVATAVLDAVLSGEPAAVPVLPVTDTVKQVGPGGTLRAAADRATLRVVQAPVAFRPALLPTMPRDALDLVRLCAAAGAPACTVPGDAAAAPLRTTWDLERAALWQPAATVDGCSR